MPVDQSNYYGSPEFDYDHADQNTLLARVEHNLTPRWQVTNQTRYNKTEREAVISSHRRAYAPATETVTIAAAGQRPREPDHLEPDRAVGSLR